MDKVSGTPRRGMLRLGLAGATVAAIPHAAQSLQRGHAPRILVFDVNETLLDLRALEPHFERAFGDKTMLREWFHHVIEYAEALTLTGDYRAFGDVARAALQMTAKSQGVALSANDEQQIVGGIRNLPAHTEVPKSLDRLKSAGLRMVTLTNSPPAVVEAQMKYANLQQYFERNFSVDAIRKYKPAPGRCLIAKCYSETRH